MSQASSAITLKHCANPNYRRLLTLHKDTNTRRPIVEILSDTDIDHYSYMAATIGSLAALNGQVVSLSDHQKQYETIIGRCVEEEANGDWEINFVRAEKEFNNAARKSNFTVLSKNDPTSIALTRADSLHTISFHLNVPDHTIEALASADIPTHTILAATLQECAAAAISRKSGQRMTKMYSAAVKKAKQARSSSRWSILTELNKDEQDKRRQSGLFYAALSADGTICFSREQADRLDASASTNTANEMIPSSSESHLPSDG